MEGVILIHHGAVHGTFRLAKENLDILLERLGYGGGCSKPALVFNVKSFNCTVMETGVLVVTLDWSCKMPKMSASAGPFSSVR